MRLQQPFTPDAGRIKAALRAMQVTHDNGQDAVVWRADFEVKE